MILCYIFAKIKRLKAYIDGEKLWYPDLVDRICPYEGDLSHFIREPVGSFDTIIQFYNIWAKNSSILDESLCIVRYEDIQKDPHKELRKILDFIGIKHAKHDIIDKAVEYSSFQKMQKRERNREAQSIKINLITTKAQQRFFLYSIAI